MNNKKNTKIILIHVIALTLFFALIFEIYALNYSFTLRSYFLLNIEKENDNINHIKDASIIEDREEQRNQLQKIRENFAHVYGLKYHSINEEDISNIISLSDTGDAASSAKIIVYDLNNEEILINNIINSTIKYSDIKNMYAECNADPKKDSGESTNLKYDNYLVEGMILPLEGFEKEHQLVVLSLKPINNSAMNTFSMISKEIADGNSEIFNKVINILIGCIIGTMLTMLITLYLIKYKHCKTIED